MKRKIILLLIAFFSMIPSVSAATQINDINMVVNVDANGDATVIENWTVNAQSITHLEKRFTMENGIKISDIQVMDKNSTQYTEEKEFDASKTNIFSVEDNGIRKIIKISSVKEDNTYTITYKVEGLISKYTDVYGFNYQLLAKTTNQTVSTFNAQLIFPIQLNETNAALYAHGSDMEAKFKDGYISVFASNLTSSSKIRVMTSFNELTFTKANEINKTFKERYEEVINTNDIIEEIKYFMSTTTMKYILLALGAIVLISILSQLKSRLKKVDEYTGIVTENKKTVTKLQDIPYFDSVPCNGDLYKISLLAGYFKISKNRSNLIGAIILKWIYEGFVKVGYENNRPYIKILNAQQGFDRKLDMDLYEILNASSSYGLIEGTKLSRYTSEHYLRVMTWFNMGFNETISDEFSRGNIKKIKKMRKVQLVVGEKLIEEANRIQGLKRYLLNFNQVPRQTELTEQGYKYLLCCAELLGIGTDVAKEILRKNPENIMAKQLLELEQAGHIFKNVYQTALGPYKQVVKNKKLKLAYDPEFDKLVNQRGQATEQRQSRL